MKIAIVGGGISGCAAYLELKSHLPKPPPGEADHEITIYEAYSTDISAASGEREGPTYSATLTVGGGLGVAPNGLSVLKRLDETLLQDIARGGYKIATSNLKSKNGTLLMRMDATADPDPSAGPTGGHMHLLGTSRHSLWLNLRLRIPDCDIVNRRVARVEARPNGRNVISFVDGSSPVEADLVLGADGVKGCTKRALFPEDVKEDPYPPRYEGLVGVGGFIPAEEVKTIVEEGSMNFIFGGNGFFGYFFSDSEASDPHRDSVYHVSRPGSSLGWWSTYAVDECPDTKTLNMDDVLRQLREKHAHWKDPVIQKILGSLQIKNMYPTWTLPQLPTWERDGVVLLGDAAHALPSTSGQGSSQALEDTESFALILRHHLHKLYERSSSDTLLYKQAITDAAKQYMMLRQPRVQGILEAAQKMQNSKRGMGIMAEYGMYCAMWVAGCFPAMVSRPTKHVFNYDLPEHVERLLEQEDKSCT